VFPNKTNGIKTRVWLFSGFLRGRSVSSSDDPLIGVLDCATQRLADGR